MNEMKYTSMKKGAKKGSKGIEIWV